MAELEDSTESLHEKIHEEAHHAEGNPKERWILYVALFTALIAVLAAISGLLSGHHENESLISQIRASDQWNFYQAKGIKQEIVAATFKTTGDTASLSRIKKYKEEQADIKKEAEDFEKETKEHLGLHMKLAKAVTLFQVAIAISAISILTRRKFFWYIGIAFALAGCYFLILGAAHGIF